MSTPDTFITPATVIATAFDPEMDKLRNPELQAIEKGDVAAGAKLLDAYDRTWFTAMDREEFDLADGQKCALGQLFPEPQQIPRWQEYDYPSLQDAIAVSGFGEREFWSHPVCMANFAAGRILLGLTEEQCSLYGFERRQVIADGRSTKTRYHAMDYWWAREITNRLEAQAAPAQVTS